jgi:hypothetical protein
MAVTEVLDAIMRTHSFREELTKDLVAASGDIGWGSCSNFNELTTLEPEGGLALGGLHS